MVGGTNITRRVIRFIINLGFSELADLFEKQPFSLLRFVFRSAIGEFPEYYWRRVIYDRFPNFRWKLEKLIKLVEKRNNLRAITADFIAEHIASTIRGSSPKLPFKLPNEGLIVDVESGYLTGLSGDIVKYALWKGEIIVYLIDNGLGPSMVIPRVLKRIGASKNIVFMHVDIESVSSVDDAQLITFLHTLHEITNRLFETELMRSFGEAKMDWNILAKELPKLRTIINKIHSILGDYGRIVVVDKKIDDYDADFVGMLINDLFDIIRTEYLDERRFLVEAKKQRLAL